MNVSNYKHIYVYGLIRLSQVENILMLCSELELILMLKATRGVI